MGRTMDHARMVETIKRLRRVDRRSLAGVARRMNLPYDDARECIVLPGYVAADESDFEVAFPSASSPREAAQLYCDSGDWHVGDESIAVEVNVGRRVARVNGDDVVTEIPEWTCELAIVDPEEPPCTRTETGIHRWTRIYALVGGIEENPGVYALRGCSIMCTRVCIRCGMAHQTVSNSQGENTLYDHDKERYIADYVDDDALKRYRSRR